MKTANIKINNDQVQFRHLSKENRDNIKALSEYTNKAFRETHKELTTLKRNIILLWTTLGAMLIGAIVYSIM